MSQHIPSSELQDVQGRNDQRGVVIQKVGIKDIRYPMQYQTKAGEWQQSFADYNLSVYLPADKKGTHMSRMVDVFNTFKQYSAETVEEIMTFVLDRLQAPKAYLELRFPIFIEKAAPETGKTSLMEYEGIFKISADENGVQLETGVGVNVTSLCPCSKEISDYGAHNQRSLVEIFVKNKAFEIVAFEDLIQIAESSASSPLFPLLKREDERHVTMLAYDNPVFVEDLSRNVALKLQEFKGISAFNLRVTNYESIHKHNAFAEISMEL